MVGIIGKNIEPVKNPPSALELLKNSNERYAYIETRSILEFGLQRFNITDYMIPSQSKESSLYLINAGVVIQKGFTYEKQFNKM